MRTDLSLAPHLSTAQPCAGVGEPGPSSRSVAANVDRLSAAEHPLGVRPLGAALEAGIANIRARSLGDLALLSDETLLSIVGNLDAPTLVKLSSASKALYCFANHDEVWKALVIEEHEGCFVFQHTWKDTYVSMQDLQSCNDEVPPQKRRRSEEGNVHDASTPAHCERRLRIENFFSDVLYQSHLCATHPILEEWLQGENQVPRRRGLTAEQFRHDFEIQGRPVVLEADPAFARACAMWDMAYLARELAGKEAIAGNMPAKAEEFFRYMRQQCDDMPLYMFDKNFANSSPALVADYSVPSVFSEDLFSLLGDQRPDFRWLIIGPKRSGSPFHVDPNATSAWNACVRGSKLWIMFPPGRPPPGVYASSDGTSVAAPVSIIEWFLAFFDSCVEECADVGWLRAVTRPGDVIFVPRGWWHCVLNLEDDTVAVTHNYVSAANLDHVLAALETRDPDLVSGCPYEDRATLFDRFLAALRQHKPGLVQNWEARKAAAAAERRKAENLSGMFGPGSKRAAKKVCAMKSPVADDAILPQHDDPAAANGGFCFNFSVG